MRISLRWKMLALLLATALVPLGVTTLILRSAERDLGAVVSARMHSMGKEVGRDVAQTLNASAGRELVRSRYDWELLGESLWETYCGWLNLARP